jgi:hypothetical protein
MVMRHVDAGRVETPTLYRLTDLGHSLDEPLAARPKDRLVLASGRSGPAALNQRSE